MPRLRGEDYELLKKVYEWVFVPMSVWPVDVKGLCLHLLDCMENGRQVDERTRVLCEMLVDAPRESAREPIAEYEHAVKEGNYESLIQAQYKFDSMEVELAAAVALPQARFMRRSDQDVCAD